MTNISPLVTEEDLHGFADGRLDPDRREMVTAYLANNPQQQARVDAWIAQDRLLRAEFEGVLYEPVPPEMTVSTLVVARSEQHWRLQNWSALRIAAALVFAAGIGAATGWFGRGGIQPRATLASNGISALKLETNAAYRIMSRDQGAFIIRPVVATQNIDPIVSKIIGGPVVVPDLSGDGYRLIGSGLMATLHGPAIVLVYRGAHHMPLVLLVRKMDAPSPSSTMTESRHQDHVQFTWIRRGIGFSVASSSSPSMLHPIANRIQRDETSL